MTSWSMSQVNGNIRNLAKSCYMRSYGIAYYRPPTKLREGNAFTGVCHSVHGGGEAWLVPGPFFGGGYVWYTSLKVRPPPKLRPEKVQPTGTGILVVTTGAAVLILLEYILVLFLYLATRKKGLRRWKQEKNHGTWLHFMMFCFASSCKCLFSIVTLQGKTSKRRSR